MCRVAGAGFMVLFCACAKESEISIAKLSLRELPGCEFARATEIEVRAAGDFAMRSLPASAGESVALSGLPVDTRWLAVAAKTQGEQAGGLVALTGGDVQRDVLMLPLGRSCPLGDPLAAAPLGTALAALPGGGLLMAGGRMQDGASTAAAVVLAPGASLVKQVEDGMLLRRAGASATLVGTRVAIAGGGADDLGPAHDVYEIYDATTGQFDAAQSAKLADGPRRDHGAVRVPDGRVLLVGGQRARGAQPLGSAELLDVTTGRSTKVAGELRVARVWPSVLMLDSGKLLVALGQARDVLDADVSMSAVREVELLDLASDGFQEVAQLPLHAASAVTALAGDRVLYVGCSDAQSCEVALLLPQGDGFELVREVIAADVLSEQGFVGLSQLQLAALHDGRVLVTARAANAFVTRSAFVLDLNRASVEPTEASRVPAQLRALDDGAFAELDAEGASLRRHDLLSAFDDAPKSLLSADSSMLALDVPARWAWSAQGLRALEEARFDLPYLSFAAVRIEFDLDGEGALLIEPETAPALAIEIAEESLSLGRCALSRSLGDAISVERQATTITLRAGKGSRTCQAAELNGRVGVAFALKPEAMLGTLAIERL